MTPGRQVVIVAVAAALLAILTSLGVGGPVALVAALALVVGAPALALGPLLPTGSRLTAAALGAGLGLAAGVLACTALLALEVYSVGLALAAVGAVCAVGWFVQLRSARATREGDVIQVFAPATPPTARAGGDPVVERIRAASESLAR